MLECRQWDRKTLAVTYHTFQSQVAEYHMEQLAYSKHGRMVQRRPNGTRRAIFVSTNTKLDIVGVSFLGCNARWTYNQTPTFRRNVLLSSSTVIMEAVCCSEIIVSTFKSTQRFDPEGRHRHLQRRESLQSRKSAITFYRLLLASVSEHAENLYEENAQQIPSY
jgi:hypothetical protein